MNVPKATLVLVLPLLACATANDADRLSHQQEIDQWRTARAERLRQDDGWLTLVGLMPLQPGSQTFGSAADNDLVFPEKAPARAGTISWNDSELMLTAHEEAGVLVNGTAAGPAAVALQTDAQEERSLVQIGDLSFFIIDREGKLYVRLKDARATTLLQFDGMDNYPVQYDWRITGRFEAFDEPQILSVPNVLGYVSQEECPGELVFERNGATHRLRPMNASGGQLFVVFGDRTNGQDTYGGGRFLYVDAVTDPDSVVIDFNRAYNPPCVFTPYATCPLPPEGNSLDLEVLAGERAFVAHDQVH